MSYLPNENTTFINIKLTDDGRRLLSLGQLTFNKALLSDREINYGINGKNRTGTYDISCCNRILAPKDSAPGFLTPLNFDDSDAVPITVGSAKQIVTATTGSVGFFTGSTNNWGININETAGFIGSNTINYATYKPNGSDTVILGGGGNNYFPKPGELTYIQWQPDDAGVTYSAGTEMNSGTPFNNLWYRVVSADTGTTSVTFDRNVPDFTNTTAVTHSINTYFYPFKKIDDQSSATTITSQVWNMNIIRTSSVEGTDSSISGYTTYGSIEYNGTKQFLGFLDETRQFGVVHYTNGDTGNTYAEQLYEKTVVVDIPNIMWHKSNPYQYGVNLTDSDGLTTFDSVAQTTYRELKTGGFSVGRVYHKLKLIVITDPELLTALTYKSNRAYTLPPLTLDSTSNPGSSCSTPITATTVGLLEEGYAYFVTYKTESNSGYTQGESYGYQKTLPCQYIQRIDGVLDGNNSPQYLRAFFNTSSFPYLRNSSDMDGTGWNANKIQLMINKVKISDHPNINIDTIPTDNWRLIESGAYGGGVYTGATGSSTIDPLNLTSHQFVVSNEDYVSGSTYILENDFTVNNDISQSGLTFGSESFFFGNINTSIMATVYKSVMTVLAPDTEFNSSNNLSFDSLKDSDTFLTEVGILNNDNVLVAIGKPTYPIKKNNSRYLAFQLEIDF